MDTRNIRLARCPQRGNARPVVLAVIAVFVLLGIGAWLLIFRPHEQILEADAGKHGVLPGAVTEDGNGSANVQSMSLNQLLEQARKAMNDQRYLAPAGNNAFEYYLRVLEKQPGNQVAADALRETFPFAATAAEQAINQRDFNDAQRQIELLAKADPSNYTLTILRSKLDAQRKLLDKEQQQALDQQKQLAARQAEASRLAAEAVAAKQRADQAAAAQQAAQQAAARQAVQVAATEPARPAASPRPAANSSDPVLLQQVNPRYPVSAMRASQEGWVELEFVVDAEGTVDDVKVLNSQPRHVFDRAAIDAVSRWRFQPGTLDGQPHATRLQRRIQFKLNQ